MGNEGSLPSSDESEGMEYNPSSLSPSSVGGHSRSSNNNTNNNDPRAMASGNIIVDAGVIPVGVGVGGNQQHQGNSRSSGGGGERSSGSSGGGHHGGRLKGSVFTRRSQAHNQNSTGIERTNQQLQQQQQQQSSAESVASYPPSQSSVNLSSSGVSAYHTPIPSMAGEELAYINPGNITTQHPYQNTNNINAHQQQQQQMYAQQQQQHQQQQQQHYYNNNTVPINDNLSGATSSNTTTTKKTIPGQRAGSAILKTMRNLNIGSAMHRIGGGSSGNNARSPVTSPGRGSSKRQQQQQQNQQQQQQQVNDWETRWDEDSEDDDDEDDHNEVNNINQSKSNLSHNHQQQQNQHRSTTLPPTQHTSNTTNNNHIHNNTLLRPELRPPEIDSGYTAAAAAVVTNINMTPTTQFQHHLAYPPGQPTTTTTKTATPDSPIQQQQTPHVIDDDDDGVEWDTGIGVSDADIAASDCDGTDLDDTRPNVQQFLPLLRVLGKGSFGKVVLVQKSVGREQGVLFAMKILKKSHLVRRRQIERTRTERKVLSAVNHPFIMKLHYAFQSPDKLYLVLDYCPGGELFFHLSRFRRFPERVARFYAAELLLALGHLHKRGIIYRDLKPENVLLDADGHVKLGDFGLAKAGIRHAYEGATSMCGTPEYMAPEVLAQQGHGFCVDYWGLGMLTYEMMTGLPPWYTTDRAKLFRRLRSAPLDIPPYFSAQSASFTSALLERNPRRRLGVTGIRAAMENDFFKSISWRALYGRRVEAPIRPCEGWSPPAGGDENEQTSSSQQPSSQVNNVPTDLDAATANFDNQFTRMPVETDDKGNDDNEDLEELHEDTFVGFTFDDDDRDAAEAAHQQKQQISRQKTQHIAREGHHID